MLGRAIRLVPLLGRGFWMSTLTIVAKITDQCNLYCGYCYYYANGNEGLRTRKEPLATERLAQLGSAIAQIKSRGVFKGVNVVLHGGEPLLVKRPSLEGLIEPVRNAFGEAADFSLQTNGVLIDEDWLDFFQDYGIGVGVSIDAVEEFHNERRPGARGRPSFSDAVAGYKRLAERAKRNGSNLPGVISVYDERVTASQYWHHFVEILEAERFDILFPDEAMADKRIYDQVCDDFNGLVEEIWEIQTGQDDPNVRFRFFQNAIAKYGGMRAGKDASANPIVPLVTVDLQGSVFYDDGLRHAIPANELKVGDWFEDNLSDLAIRMIKRAEEFVQLPERCSECSFLSACGGGELTYRYSPISRQFDSYALCKPSKGIFDYLNELQPC